MAIAERDVRALVGRADQAEIDGHGFRGAEATHHPLLEDPQELRLEVHRHLGDLVEEERPAVGFLEQPDLFGGRARERAPRVAEELRFDQVLGQRRAVDLDPRAVSPVALLVERVREELLAGAALAHDEHIGVGVRHRRDRLQHALDTRRAAEDFGVGDLVAEPAFEVGVLADQLPVLERVLEEAQELVRLERLLEDVKRAGTLRGFHRLAYRTVRGDDEHFERRIASLQLSGELQPVAVGQHQIHDGGVRVALDEGAQRLPHASGGAHTVAFALERHAKAVGDRLLVVDDENRVSAFHCNGDLGGRL